MTILDPTDALEKINPEGPEIEIAGETYRLRRLGISDVFKISHVIREVFRKGSEEVMFITTGKDPMDAMSLVLMLGFTHAEDKILKLFAYLLEVNVDELQDPRRFPMASFVQIVSALMNHPDLVSFFDAMKTNNLTAASVFGMSNQAPIG